MAYTMTTQQFFEGPLAAFLTQPSELRDLGGVIEFAIEGERGGTWSVDLKSGAVAQREATEPNCIIRAQAIDFLALVEGRMSVSDGLLTDRLQITGDMGRLTRLIELVESVGEELAQ